MTLDSLEIKRVSILHRISMQPSTIIAKKLPKGIFSHFMGIDIHPSERAFTYCVGIGMVFRVNGVMSVVAKHVELPEMYKEIDHYDFIVRQIVEMYYKIKG